MKGINIFLHKRKVIFMYKIIIILLLASSLNIFSQSDTMTYESLLETRFEWEAKELKINLNRYLKWSLKYKDIIKKANIKYSIPINLIESVITVESKGSPNAKGTSNCNGLMQVQGGSFNPERAVMSGTGILKHYIDKCNGDTAKGLTAYNRGFGGMRKYYRKHGHPSNYAVRVLRIYEFYKKYNSDNILDTTKEVQNEQIKAVVYREKTRYNLLVKEKCIVNNSSIFSSELFRIRAGNFEYYGNDYFIHVFRNINFRRSRLEFYSFGVHKRKGYNGISRNFQKYNGSYCSNRN